IGGGVLYSIGDGEAANIPAVDGHENGCAAWHCAVTEARAGFWHADLRHEREIADRYSLSVDDTENSLAGDGVEVFRMRELQALLRGSFHDYGAQRMFAGALQAGGKTQQFGVIQQFLRHTGEL